MPSAASSVVLRATLPALLIGLLTAQSACTSQQDDISTPVIDPQSSGAGGIYIGTDSAQSGAAATVIGLLDAPSDGQNQRIELYANDGSSMQSGIYTTTATSGFAAQTRYFASAAAAGSTPPTATLSGNFTSTSQILATYSRTDGASGTYNLSYQSALYQQPSTLATVAGTWVVQDSFGAVVTSFSVSSGGSVSGSTTTPDCTYSGTVAIVDLRFNVYALSLNESCTVAIAGGGSTSTTASLSGLATLLPASATLGTTTQQLVLAAASTGEGRLFRLSPSD